ncbi:MAG: threonylcarbamoyl-AMP synthase [Dehalococcoidia bacterium]|nr:threonylcarbamoyl-AMP synthase [Dehalococcoidia bacterium]
MPILPPDRASEVVARLLDGGVVVVPTDTVYGLAALATSAEALRALAELKGRDAQQPIAVLVDSVAAVAPYLERTEALDPVARFWPGALTAVVRARPGGLAAPVVTAEGTIGVRIPDDDLARTVIRGVGGVIAASSANRHGEPPALTAAEAARAFPDLLVLDGGDRTGGVPSTVVDLTGDRPRVLREGPVTAAMLGIAP